MQKVIYEKNDGMKVPLKIWADDLDTHTIEQAKNICNLPFIHKWMSIMPDGHYCRGVPVGTVLPCDGYVIPSAVGMDVGCGLCVLNTGIYIDNVDVDSVMATVTDRVAIYSFDDMINKGHYDYAKPFERKVDETVKADEVFRKLVTRDSSRIWNRLDSRKNILNQMGTLGDSNHFFELQVNSEGIVHIMIHSGSRAFGAAVGKSYDDLAKALCTKWNSYMPCPELPYLPMDSEEGQSYYRMMNIACEYAYMNRFCMMLEGANVLGLDADFVEKNMVNIHHNYAALENHYGKNVVVHRKGATCVRKGITGIIPGSMTTKSYIVDGLGSDESFHSCSHGSGRPYSRTESKKRVAEGVDPSQEDQLASAGVTVYGSDDVSDELGTSYKDIDSVMNLQTDLVSICTELTPVAVLKG